MALFADNPLPLHTDVFRGNPTDATDKSALIEDIRSRARGALAAKNCPLAEALYSRGLELSSDAPLFANRSAARVGMGRFREALEDAEAATKLDPQHAKGWYRKGQACAGMGMTAAAADAFERAAALEPANDAWRARAGGGGGGGDDVAAVAADMLRGYKKTADGRVTPYFSREVSEQEKALIGDTTPQRIEAGQVEEKGGAAAARAWNHTGTTWEERNAGSWCKQRLTDLLSNVEVETPPGRIHVTRVVGIDGDASVMISRGKRRCLFEYNITVEWEAEWNCGTCKGVMQYPDVSDDCEGKYEFAVEVDAASPPNARPYVDIFIKGERAGLRAAINEAFAAFVDEFNTRDQ